ncbi:MAG: protease inhibitor I42 family protein [Planctomycetota bacterium]|nr:protease inhibitor I42 family protein [Planctomycetota bacterium]
MIRSLLTIAFLLLASCAISPQEEILVISRAFTTVDAEQKIILSKNRSFEIKLPSNPDTGYDWVLKIDNPDVVFNESRRYRRDHSGRKGLGGETTWSLRTGMTGDAVLTYSYQNEINERLLTSQTMVFIIGVR